MSTYTVQVEIVGSAVEVRLFDDSWTSEPIAQWVTKADLIGNEDAFRTVIAEAQERGIVLESGRTVSSGDTADGDVWYVGSWTMIGLPTIVAVDLMDGDLGPHFRLTLDGFGETVLLVQSPEGRKMTGEALTASFDADRSALMSGEWGLWDWASDGWMLTDDDGRLHTWVVRSDAPAGAGEMWLDDGSWMGNDGSWWKMQHSGPEGQPHQARIVHVNVDGSVEPVGPWQPCEECGELRVSVSDVRDGRLPTEAAGVHWRDTEWTECYGCLTDPGWRDAMDPSDERTGVVLFGEVKCDACGERAQS